MYAQRYLFINKGLTMISKLQQTILQNVINSTFSDKKNCTVNFSRFDKVEISDIKKLFDLDIVVQGIKPVEAQQKWSDMINSSKLDATFEAQAQYINVYMQDLFPDLQKKKVNKP